MKRRELLRLEHVTKTSGSLRLLEDLNLLVLSGEQLQITGLSGSGIEPLWQVLSGRTVFDSGHIWFDGQDYPPGVPLSTEEMGIYSISGTGSLIPQMTVAENIFLLRPHPFFQPAPSRRTINRQAKSLLAEFGLSIPPDMLAGNLRFVEQQALNFVKAYARNAKLILVHGVAGPYPESQNQLFSGVTRQMRKSGIAVISISSSPFGFFDHYDRSIVMRDGTRAKTIYPQFLMQENPLKYAVDGELPEPAPRREYTESPMAFRCFDLSLGKMQKLSFGVHRGEIVGIFDSDNTDLLQALEGLLTGSLRAESGYMLLGGHPFAPRDLGQAVKAGLAYIDGVDPDSQLIEHISVAENILLPSMRKAPRLGIFRNHAVERSINDTLDNGSLRSFAHMPVQDIPESDYLTKLVILYHRWGIYRPRLLLYSDPFSQTDPVLRMQIQERNEHLTSLGIGDLVLAPRLRDLVFLCDRIRVYRDGRFMQEHRKVGNQFPALNQPHS